MLLPLLHHMALLNNGNCRLTMPVIKGCFANGVLLHNLIDNFKSNTKISTTIKHIYNESANIFEGCNVAFDTNDCWNVP